MLGIVSFGAFLATSLILNITPGADTIYILTRSLSGGHRCGLASVFGISTGILVHTTLAGLGLSLILAQSDFAFLVLKTAGAGYLIYLGLKTLFSKSSLPSVQDSAQVSSVKNAYLQGILTNVLNPKVALFFLTFLPQFVDSTQSYGPLPFILLGLIYATTSTLWYCVLVLLSIPVSKIMKKENRLSIALSKLPGIIYVGLGILVFQTQHHG